MNKIRDLQSQRFGRLMVICNIKRRSNAGTIIWLCRCDCGNLKEIRSGDLVWGNIKSCGCLRIERSKEARRNDKVGLNFKHGDAVSGNEAKVYRSWKGIKARCLNPNEPAYKNYGGRGIKMCESWKNSYLAFKFWAMSHGYKEGLTIDRINNDGNYEPDNCQWLTRSENAKKPRQKRNKHE